MMMPRENAIGTVSERLYMYLHFIRMNIYYSFILFRKFVICSRVLRPSGTFVREEKN